MAKQRKVSRRTFIGAAAGAAGATALSPLGPSLSLGHDKHGHNGDRLVPRDRIGCPAVVGAGRDHAARRIGLGLSRGEELPVDPTDLGPLVPLPGGFASVFAYLASVGYRGFEFFSFSQGANGAITTSRSGPRSTAPGWSPPARTPAACSR